MLSKEMKKYRWLVSSSFVAPMGSEYKEIHHLMAKGQDVRLPRKMIVTGYCDLANARIEKMPETMIVHGAINMKGAKVLSGGMPKAIIVDEWADFSGSNITRLPDNMFVGQWMNLKGSNITKLPNNLTVGWHLDLDGEKIVSIGKNLMVGGHLDLNGSGIRRIPKKMVVYGDLLLSRSGIKALSGDLVVKGDLWIEDTAVTEIPSTVVVGRGIYMRGTHIEELPENFIVGRLRIGGTDLRELPEGLVVERDIDLQWSKIRKLPDEYKVGWSIEWRKSNLRYEDKSTKYSIWLRRFKPVEVVSGRYIFANGELFQCTGHTHQVGAYTVYVGRIPGDYMVTDGEYWQRCHSARKGIMGCILQRAIDQDSLDTRRRIDMQKLYSANEMRLMYRLSTGVSNAIMDKAIRDYGRYYPLKEQYSIDELCRVNFDSWSLKMRGFSDIFSYRTYRKALDLCAA